MVTKEYSTDNSEFETEFKDPPGNEQSQPARVQVPSTPAQSPNLEGKKQPKTQDVGARLKFKESIQKAEVPHNSSSIPSNQMTHGGLKKTNSSLYSQVGSRN